MLGSVKLLLPALIPSWRFFETVEASPRIEFTLLKAEDGRSDEWQEFRPRPEYLSLSAMLKRLFWNPLWNESLFLVSCAERLMDHPTEHSRQEIRRRIITDLKMRNVDIAAMPYFQFRLIFIRREGEDLEKSITYLSPVYKISEGTEP
tara:strand:+ start:24984 stop:25427 length:444 start_codon:yes stop_codon:yes gene_type:complete